jgi:hypothetical protein
MSDQEQDKDPVVGSSLSKPLFIWSALLLLSLGWALYDEVYGIRPWKSYEARFAKLYTRYLGVPKTRATTWPAAMCTAQRASWWRRAAPPTSSSQTTCSRRSPS